MYQRGVYHFTGEQDSFTHRIQCTTKRESLRHSFKSYVSLTAAKDKLTEPAEHVQLLTHCMEPDAMTDIYNSFMYVKREDQNNLNTVLN